MDWDYAAVVFVSSLGSASVLIIASLGLAVIFGMMGVINLAHGEFIMFGAYAALIAMPIFRTRSHDKVLAFWQASARCHSC